jgi:hypothetical protein
VDNIWEIIPDGVIYISMKEIIEADTKSSVFIDTFCKQFYYTIKYIFDPT